jgi:alkylhydroperoxidase/carboxymuconolactone decarboxylase family protein YurZ
MDGTKPTTEQLLKEMETGRGYVYPAHRYVAEHDPEFLDAYNRLAGMALLHGDRDDGTHALPAKYREMVVCGILAFKGSVDGVATHAKRAIELGATEQELFEAFQAIVVPGGAPAFLNGVRGLMQLRDRKG